MYKLSLTKPDGRALYLYSARPIHAGEVSVPEAGPVSPAAHFRWHPFRAEWVAYASHRQDRTFLPPPEYNPLAPSRSGAPPTELPEGDYDVAVFENLFPTLSARAEADPPPDGYVPTMRSSGACEVVVFTQDPGGSLGRLPLAHLDLIFQVWVPADLEVIVIHSGVHHSNAGGEYNRRREECERACALLGIGSLRDLPPERAGEIESLPEPERRRARHVLRENARVLDAVEVLQRDDTVELGRLFNASHESMRLDYEITVPEIDLLAEELRREEGVFGARMTGGGFGGSVVALARSGAGARAAADAARHYAAASGRNPTVIVPPA